jgi:hypothetical protein
MEFWKQLSRASGHIQLPAVPRKLVRAIASFLARCSDRSASPSNEGSSRANTRHQGDEAMSWWATAYVGAATLAPNGEALTRDEKLMGFIIADHHETSSNCAWPSVPRLAEMALMGKRHANEVIHSLKRKGFLAVRPGNGRGNTAEYVLVGLPPYPGKGAQPAPFISQKKLPKMVQKRCTETQEKVQKGCTVAQRNKEEPNEPINQPRELEAHEFVERVMAIGFRDSTRRTKPLIERALFEEVQAGALPDEVLEGLCRIYRWTENGMFAPKCFEVIPRWREPRELWERRNGKQDDRAPGTTRKAQSQLDALEQFRQAEARRNSRMGLRDGDRNGHGD